jgi:hypothetical protein
MCGFPKFPDGRASEFVSRESLSLSVSLSFNPIVPRAGAASASENRVRCVRAKACRGRLFPANMARAQGLLQRMLSLSSPTF